MIYNINHIPIGSMYAIYGNMDPINIPQMLAYIYHTWILWDLWGISFPSQRWITRGYIFQMSGSATSHCEAPLKLLEGNAIRVPELQSCCVFVRPPEDLGCCLWYIANKIWRHGEQWISCTYIYNHLCIYKNIFVHTFIYWIQRKTS